MLSYEQLKKLLLHNHVNHSVRKNYLVINVPESEYHITIFQDQWDMYETETSYPYYLFHLSSNSEKNRCSIYFWVDKKNYRIKSIPSNLFLYDQPIYTFTSSTRSPCFYGDIKFLLKYFQKILNKALKK